MKQSQIFRFDSTESMTDEAVDWLRKTVGDEHVLVCISGGKDSIVAAELVRMAGLSYSLQSTLTGIDPPQVTRFLRRHYPTCQFVRPAKSFWDLIGTANPPGGTGRAIKWCCTQIKEKPSRLTPIAHRVLGIRAEESSSRASYERINYWDGQVHYHPILHWKEWQIWEFIHGKSLPYPSLYDEGFDRIGCVICPNHHGHHEPYRERWPNHFKCFEAHVTAWWHKRKAQGRDMWHDSPRDFLKDWYAGKFFYYRTGSKAKNSQRKLF